MSKKILINKNYLDLEFYKLQIILIIVIVSKQLISLILIQA